MFARNIRIPRTAIAFALAAGLALATTTPSFAQDGTVATITGGSLTITLPAAADFAAKSITGVAQTTTAALAAFSASDLRGTGAGWHVTAQATQFDNGQLLLLNRKLAASSLSMSQPTVASPDTTSADPTIATGPYTIDGASPVSIASAALNAGMGKYDFSATTLTLALPADVYANSYSSTVTVSVVTAP